MSTNMTSNIEEGFSSEIPSETTSLLQQSTTTRQVNGTLSTSTGHQDDEGQQQQQQQQQQDVLWEEMDRPWPSTYERAISLLSSPILQVQQVDMLTRSPKPGSSMTALARRRNFERGFYTPETGPMSVTRRMMEQFATGTNNNNNRDDNYDDEDDDDDDNNNNNHNNSINTTDDLSKSWRTGSSGNASKNRSNMAQLKSMEFFKRYANANQKSAGTSTSTTTTTTTAPVTSLLQVQQKQIQKANEAKEYREQILKNANKKSSATSSKTKTNVSSTTTSTSSSMTQGSKPAASSSSKASSTSGGGGHGSSAILRESSFMQCVFNLANILMGMGLLGLPYAFNAAGWFGGGVSLLIFGIVTWWTSILIGRELNGDPRPASYFVDSPYKTPVIPGSVNPMARMLSPVSSFPDIARRSFGEGGALVLSIILYFELFSCICIFLVSIGDHLHELIPSYSMSQHVVMATIVSLIPTVLLRTPKLLSYFSMLGTCATVIVVLVVIAAAIIEGDISDQVATTKSMSTTTTTTTTALTRLLLSLDDDTDVDTEEEQYHVLWRSQGLILALGIISYCFSGHAIVPSIYSSMERPQQFEKMVSFTFTVVIVACFSVAVSGYYMFGTTVADQVTLSLKQNSKATYVMNALTCLMVLTALSKITLTMFPLALGIEEIFTPYLTSDKMVGICSVTIKVTLTIFASLVAIYCPSFSFLCALTGMICTMSVSVIFPAAAHYKLFYTKLSFIDKLSDVVIVIAGCIMAVVGTYMTVKEFK